MLTDKGSIPPLYKKFNSDPTINASLFKTPERRDEHLNRDKAIAKSDENTKTDWAENPTLPNKCLAYGEKLIIMFTQVESMCDRDLGSKKVGKHRIDFEKEYKWPIYSALYHGLMERALEKQEVNRMLAMDVI